MNENGFYIMADIIVGCIVGLMIGFVLGCHLQMKANENQLKKLGIEIIATRVFNGEPEYSYRTVEPIKKEESK